MNTRSEESSSATPQQPKEIKGYVPHGYDQAMGRDGGRGVTDEAMRDAVNDPIKPVQVQPHPKGPTFKFQGKNAVVVLNEQGEVVTTYAKNRTGLRNPPS